MKKVLTGLLAFLPVILFVLFFALFLVFMLMHAGQETLTESEMIFPAFILIGMFIAVILTYVSIVVFIVMACKNPMLTTGWKVGWAIIIYMLNMFVFPVYWFKYARKQ